MTIPVRRSGERVSIVSLGCFRNTVDSEKILAGWRSGGARICAPREASTVIVNTCAFTEEAKRESIEAILELLELKKKGRVRRVFVYGCLPQRYPRELAQELRDVDGFFGIADFKRRPDLGLRLTPAPYAFVKISEGCANRCAFCAIPVIKGPLRSRPAASIIEEVRHLEAQGVREVDLIGQDITLYGHPVRRAGASLPLVGLVRKILKATRIPWIRLLYLHPQRLTSELIGLFASEKRLCPYVDVPFQHASDRILKRMNRPEGRQGMKALVERLRAAVPDVAVRTTFIVGFPGETARDFRELLDFVREVRFDRLGVFSYSREEGTPAFSFKGQVGQRTKEVRRAMLMELQRQISRDKLRRKIGRVLEVLIEQAVAYAPGTYRGRSRFDAPEVDGTVTVRCPGKLRPGQIVACRITQAADHDLKGERTDESSQ